MSPRLTDRLVLFESVKARQISRRSSAQIQGRLKVAGLSLVSAAVLLLLGMSTVSVRRDAPAPKVEATQVSEQVNALPVETITVTPVDFYQVERVFTGEVLAPRTSELGFERSGEVVQLYVTEGDLVLTGEALAQLDTSTQETQRQQLIAQKAQAQAVLEELQVGPRPEKIAAARALVKDLNEQLKLNQRKQTRREFLQEQGAISLEQLDEASFNANALKERLSAAQSELDELLAGTRSEQIKAQQAVVRQLEARLASIELAVEKSTLRSPFGGKIAARVDEGTIISAGDMVVRLVEAGRPEARIDIPVAAVDLVQLGSQHQVAIAQENYQAQVTAILPEVNSSTRTQTVVLTLPADSTVAPGQIAQWKLTERIPVEGYWLPTEALVKGSRGLWSCYKLTDRSSRGTYRLEQQAVEILHQESNRVLVRGTLQPGDRVVKSGTHRLVAGQLAYPSQDSQLTESDRYQMLEIVK